MNEVNPNNALQREALGFALLTPTYVLLNRNIAVQFTYPVGLQYIATTHSSRYSSQMSDLKRIPSIFRHGILNIP